VSKVCRYFGIGRASFSRWRKAYADKGEADLIAARCVPHNHPDRVSTEVEEDLLHLRRRRRSQSQAPWTEPLACVGDPPQAAHDLPEFRMCYGHEFQARFHWHVEAKGVRHVYIKPSRPRLNGEVERSNRSGQQEIYQLLSYKDDVDLEERPGEWERLRNIARPDGAFNGKTPYEALRE
jgi:transposase InsO family protein